MRKSDRTNGASERGRQGRGDVVDARKKPRTKTEPPPPPAPGHVYERSTHLADNGGVFSRRPLRFEPSVVFSFRGILHAAAANRTTTRPTGDDGSTTLTLKKKKKSRKTQAQKTSFPFLFLPSLRAPLLLLSFGQIVSSPFGPCGGSARTTAVA